MKRYAELGILAFVVLLVAPSAAWACPACLVMSEENRVAFAQTAVALSLLPLGMVGSVGIWLRSRARDNVPEDFETEGDQD